jgi:hypothetical protein
VHHACTQYLRPRCAVPHHIHLQLLNQLVLDIQIGVPIDWLFS